MHQNLVFLKLFVTMTAWVPNCEIENFYEFFSFLNFHFFLVPKLSFSETFCHYASLSPKVWNLNIFLDFEAFSPEIHMFQLPKIPIFSVFSESQSVKFEKFYDFWVSFFNFFQFSRFFSIFEALFLSIFWFPLII